MTNAIPMFNPDMMTSTPIPKAPIILLYAANGVGKSSFLTTIPGIAIADIEGKLNNSNVARFNPQNYEQFKTWLEYLLFQDKLEYKAIGVDSVDWLESLIHAKVCSNTGATTISDPYCQATNFQNGYVLAANIMKNEVLDLMGKIRDKHNIPIVMVCHASIIKRTPPDQEGYDEWDLKLHKGLAAILSERVEAKIFGKIVREKDAKGDLLPSEQRVFVAAPQKGVNAKNNLHLPNEFKVSFSHGWQDLLNVLNTKKPIN